MGLCIRNLIKYPNFVETMTDAAQARINFKHVTENFFGNLKADNDRKIVANMLATFKVHYLFSHGIF